MGGIVESATGAVMSLPAMMIQRSNPGLYELLSNGVLQARVDFTDPRCPVKGSWIKQAHTLMVAQVLLRSRKLKP